MVEFSDLSEDARLWVFPSSRKFYPQEISGLKEQLKSFLENWKNGDKDLTAAFDLRYDRFILIGVDPTDTQLEIATHDALISFIQKLESSYDALLLDKINVCYKQGAFIQYKDLIDFKQLIKNRGVSSKTVVFDNMIQVKKDLEYDWEINIMDSWLGRFFK
jgi:hypothetical protein